MNAWLEKHRDRFATVYTTVALLLLPAALIVDAPLLAGSAIWFAAAATVLRFHGQHRL